MKEKFCDKAVLGGKRATIGENGASFGVENRLVYMAGEGAPAVPGGQAGEFEQAQKALAEAAGMLPALKEQADRLQELAGKPQQDRENLKKELDAKVEEKDRLYSEISKALEGKVLSLPDKAAANFGDQLKDTVKSAIPVETVISQDVLNAASARAAVEAAKAKEMLRDIFAEEVKVKITNSGDLTNKKSFKVKYENKNIVVELSDQAASVVKTEEAKPAESEVEARAKSQIEAAKKELSGNQSLMTVLGFFGLVKNKEDGNPDLDTAVKDPVVKFVSWLFGAEFAKGAIDPLVKAASAKWPGIGEKIEGWKKELQGFTGSLLPDTPREEVDDLANAIAKNSSDWKDKGLEKKLTVTKESSVLDGDLVVWIPAGKTVDLNQDLTVKFEDGASADYKKGDKIEVGSGGRTFRLPKGTRISAGATFDTGVKIWVDKKDQEAAEGKTSEVAAAEAKKKEAPTEKPAA